MNNARQVSFADTFRLASLNAHISDWSSEKFRYTFAYNNSVVASKYQAHHKSLAPIYKFHHNLFAYWHYIVAASTSSTMSSIFYEVVIIFQTSLLSLETMAKLSYFFGHLYIV